MNNVRVTMELDTGAARSLMSKRTYYSSFENPPKLKKSQTQLCKYGNVPMDIAGEVTVNISTSNGGNRNLVLLIINEDGPSLCGRDWINALEIPINKVIESINSIDSNYANSVNSNIQAKLNSIFSKFPKVFESGLGKFKEYKVAIDVKEDAQPKFCKARPLPYALKPKIDKELDRLLLEGVIEPISHSEWAAPIVPVMKADQSVRICGDYRILNKVINIDSYPLPKHEELLSSLANGKYFAKIDLTQAYTQLCLDSKSQKYTVINTHRGLFKCNRLSFGVSSAAAIFQRTMEKLFHGKNGTLCFQDDILISGENPDELISRIIEVLTILQNAGLKLNLAKCKWMMTEITYLGLKICSEGILPTEEKVKSIINMPSPSNVTSLKSYLGMLNFYRKFLNNAATILEPLNKLLRDNVTWKWGSEQRKAFDTSKLALANSKCLVHFDSNKPISVTCDSSSYGLGAVLNLKIDGKERPVFFVSRTLTNTERAYSQTEKEALALVFALKKFHFYLWGQKFSLITDHKPLLGLFSNEKNISIMASGRIQRWSLMLQAYNFSLIHKSGKQLGTADTLSRLPTPNSIESAPVPAEWINLINFMDSTPINATLISKSTTKDPILSIVLKYCMTGWPKKVNPELQPFSCRKAELSIQNNCLLWGNRVIIPTDCRNKLISELHSEHVGASRMKQLARSYLWWPGLDAELEKLVQQCAHCLQHRSAPPHADLHPWEWPDKPWHRIHIDHCGPIKGYYFLIIIDAYSKYLEIYPTKSLTSATTIRLLRSCFSRWGLPTTIVSDNAPGFTSEEFESYLYLQGIRHVLSAPYHPSTNGLAENAVRNFKRSCGNFQGEEIQVKLDKFLFKYRLTPHTTTGISPNELLLGQKVRSVFDLLRPDETIKQRVMERQEKQKYYYDKKNPRRVQFHPNDSVMFRNYGKGPKWIPGKIFKKTGPVSYQCKNRDDEIVKRHQDQLIRRTSKESIEDTLTTTPAIPKVSTTPTIPTVSATADTPSIVLRRSKRTIKPPERLDL